MSVSSQVSPVSISEFEQREQSAVEFVRERGAEVIPDRRSVIGMLYVPSVPPGALDPVTTV